MKYTTGQLPRLEGSDGTVSRRRRDLRRAAASVLVLTLVGLFITGDLTSGELALAQMARSSPGQRDSVTVYGRISGADAPYQVVATHREGRRTIVDARTITAADGTYRLTIQRTRGVERISVVGASGKERATTVIVLRKWVDYRLDGRLRFRLKLWFIPVFGY